MTVKQEIKWIGLVTYWLVLLGFVAPAMVSSSHTELVVAAVVLVIASAYGTYRYIYGLMAFNEEEEDEDV